MNDFAKHDQLVDPDDIGNNVSDNPSFDSVLAARLSRRSLLKGSFGYAASAFFGANLVACGGGSDNANAATPKTLKLNFNAVAKSLADAVAVPTGYTYSALYRLGDPINNGTPAYANDGSESGDSFDFRAGDHHDGMAWFGLGSDGKWAPAASDKGLLVMNHENITQVYLHAAGPTADGTGNRTVADEVIKEMKAHGVSVIEVNRSGSSFTVNKASSFNRRLTTLTEMALSGPAAGTKMITPYSTDGSKTRGTVNNCANGRTPWGTYLTCEENWAGYFRCDSYTGFSPAQQTSLTRYGIKAAAKGNFNWTTATPDTDTQFSRWNLTISGADATADYRNAANTYGWVVEINPFAPASVPKKRTALGRFGHENVSFQPAVAGQPLVCYMGDDSKGEYLYKFVSTTPWDASDAGNPNAGDKYLDSGKLYAAKFNADGSGTWVELSISNPLIAAYGTYTFADQADVLINARHAADAVGATKMDRPEWVAVNPATGDAYLTLTNNASTTAPPTALSTERSVDKVDAANPRSYTDANGNKGNINGHIIRWKDATATGTAFQWDVFLFGARSSYDTTNINLSNLTADNDFSSPDGLWFGGNGVLWIETDDGAYTDVTNCMLLAAVPGTTGDGGKKTVNNTVGALTSTVDTYVGKELGNTNLRRFLVGPKECEITGITETPDGTAIFVNIQHPGENGTIADIHSHWPDGGSARPRSSTIVITKDDGGLVGGSLA